MEKFKEVFRKFGAEVTNVSTDDLGVNIEINMHSITSKIIERIELIQGYNNHVYKFCGLNANNAYGELRLTIWYIDLNKVSNVPLN